MGYIKILNCGISSYSQITGSQYSGGILGIHENQASTYMYNSYVLGNISGNKYVGGICGSSVSGMHGGNKIETQLQNLCFAGKIEGGTNIGGIIGVFSSKYGTGNLSFLNCFYLNTIAKGVSNDENIDTTGIIAKPEAYMQGQDFVNDLNRYISTYQGELEFNEWKYNEGGYPTH